ncbi:MAG: copper-binding protein [Deltaproteobacteria bacterium]|jgi:Cu/Ag efflux protein CusF|nr:copper-binding protein [Deltaproteobacteria bacterium]
MFQSTLILALLLSVAGFPAGLQAAAGHGSHGSHASGGAAATQIYTAVGSVKTVDSAGGKVFISHDPVPALKWPAMLMGFELEDPALAGALAEGDRVSFDFRVRDGRFIILDVEKLR